MKKSKIIRVSIASGCVVILLISSMLNHWKQVYNTKIYPAAVKACMNGGIDSGKEVLKLYWSGEPGEWFVQCANDNITLDSGTPGKSGTLDFR